MTVEMTRSPAVAGQFYPLEPDRLLETVQQYMADSGVAPAPERVAAIVAPHAGYLYSGPTAGSAYARVAGKRPERVVLLGCSHRRPIATASVFRRGHFATPLGAFPIDTSFADALAGETQSSDPEPHILEHALEVQLPFLVAAVGLAPIVPILFGGPAGNWHAMVGRRLAALLGDDDLVVASTDLSHYLSENTANQVDQTTLEVLMGQDPLALARNAASGRCSLCGAAAVVAAMACALARGATRWSVLDYRTSAAATGDYGRVVGYAAVTMEQPAPQTAEQAP